MESSQYRVVRDNHSQAVVIQKLDLSLDRNSTANTRFVAAVVDEGGVSKGCGDIATYTFCSATQAFHGRLLLGNIKAKHDANSNISRSTSTVELEVLSNGTKVSTTGTHLGEPQLVDQYDMQCAYVLLANFAPHGCNTLPFGGKHEYVQRHYLFLGDSSLAVVFKGLVDKLFGEGTYRPHNNAPPFREAMEQMKTGPAYATRWFDLVLRNSAPHKRIDHAHHEKRNDSTAITAGVRYEDYYSDPRMTFMYNGGSLPHLNKKGAALTGFPWDSSDLYHRELRRVVHESGRRCMPVVVFFNTGLHDLFNPHFSFDRYRLGLNRSMLQLKQLVLSELEQQRTVSGNSPCGRSTPVKWYWVSTVPLFKLYVCANYGRHGVGLINAIADELAEAHRFEVILSPFRITFLHN